MSTSKTTGSCKKPSWVLYCLFLLAIITSCTVNGQIYIGLEGGYNKNYLVTNISNRSFTAYESYSGFNAGIPVSYSFNDWFALEVDPSIIQKNYQIVRSDFFEGVNQVNTNTYLQLPVMGHFTFGTENIKGFLNLGLYGAYWSGAKVKGNIPNILNEVDSIGVTNTFYDVERPYSYNEKYSFDSRRDNRLEFGWLAGIGLSYNLNKLYRIFAEGRYYQSLTDLQKNYMINQVPRYNQTYSISAGAMVNLKLLSHKKSS